VVLSDATYQLVGHEVQRRLSGASLFESTVPVAVYCVGFIQRRAACRARSAQPESVCGRAQELAILHQRLAHAAQGRGRSSALSGSQAWASHDSSTNSPRVCAGAL
jgi:hypothetical protein